MAKKFQGAFDALTKMGANLPVMPERFKPLSGEGKPLWEFKEHDHRLYCSKRVLGDSKKVQVVLFNGWSKDQEGKTDREKREIAQARGLYAEFLNEYPGGVI